MLRQDRNSETINNLGVSEAKPITPLNQGAAPQGGSNTSRTTRQQAVQSTRAESEDSSDEIQTITAQQSTTGSISEIAQLRQELERARAEINTFTTSIAIRAVIKELASTVWGQKSDVGYPRVWLWGKHHITSRNQALNIDIQFGTVG